MVQLECELASIYVSKGTSDLDIFRPSRGRTLGCAAFTHSRDITSSSDGLLVFSEPRPPWARDARRPCRASLALFKRSAPTWTLGRVGLQSTPTDSNEGPHATYLHVERKNRGFATRQPISSACKNLPHRVGLPDAVVLGGREPLVELAGNLP